MISVNECMLIGDEADKWRLCRAFFAITMECFQRKRIKLINLDDFPILKIDVTVNIKND